MWFTHLCLTSRSQLKGRMFFLTDNHSDNLQWESFKWDELNELHWHTNLLLKGKFFLKGDSNQISFQSSMKFLRVWIHNKTIWCQCNCISCCRVRNEENMSIFITNSNFQSNPKQFWKRDFWERLKEELYGSELRPVAQQSTQENRNVINNCFPGLLFAWTYSYRYPAYIYNWPGRIQKPTLLYHTSSSKTLVLSLTAGRMLL